MSTATRSMNARSAMEPAECSEITNEECTWNGTNTVEVDAALEQARASESAALRARVDELEERIERLRQWAEGIPTYDEAGMAARTALEIMEGK